MKEQAGVDCIERKDGIVGGRTWQAVDEVFGAVEDGCVFGLGTVSDAVDEMLQRRRRLALELHLFSLFHRLLLGDGSEVERRAEPG